MFYNLISYYFSYKKKRSIPPPPVGLPWDSPPLPPESVRTDGRTLTSEQKIFRSTGYQICLPMVLRELRNNEAGCLFQAKSHQKGHLRERTAYESAYIQSLLKTGLGILDF